MDTLRGLGAPSPAFSPPQRYRLKLGMNPRPQLRVRVACCHRHPHLAHRDSDLSPDLQHPAPRDESWRSPRRPPAPVPSPSDLSCAEPPSTGRLPKRSTSESDCCPGTPCWCGPRTTSRRGGLLDAVFHLPSCAVQVFVQPPRRPLLALQRGHHKARIGAFLVAAATSILPTTRRARDQLSCV